MPPPPNRFPSGPATISPYQHQFPPQHGGQGHAGGGHPPPLGNPAYIGGPNSQLNPFAANGALGMAAGLNPAGAGAFGGHGDSGLGSHAARLGFTHGTSLQQQQQQQAQQQQAQQQQQQQQAQQQQQQQQQAQQQQQQQQQHHPQQGHSGAVLSDHPTRTQAKGRIREVWKHNLHEEMAILRDLIERYNYIAMDTEFPGLVCRPMGTFRGKSDYHYQCLRANVDMLNVLQVGITLFNEDGENPPARPGSGEDPVVIAAAAAAGRRVGTQQGPLPYTWQFNFKFSLKDDMYSQSSIDSHVQAGIDFNVLERDGIDPHEFASLMISSGMVCDDSVSWISFHGAYDFGYLTKLLWCKMLPNDEIEFVEVMKLFFPRIYDVKYHMKHQSKLLASIGFHGVDGAVVEILQKFDHKSTLETLAEVLKVKRTGPAHQAGSDSLLTGRAFFQMRDRVFGGKMPEDTIGQVWGLEGPDGSGPTAALAAAAAAAAAVSSQQQQPMDGGGPNGTHQQQNGGAPSTPNSVPAGLATTPGPPSHHSNGMGMGPMTPGGGGGVFGNFSIHTSGR